MSSRQSFEHKGVETVPSGSPSWHATEHESDLWPSANVSSPQPLDSSPQGSSHRQGYQQDNAYRLQQNVNAQQQQQQQQQLGNANASLPMLRSIPTVVLLNPNFMQRQQHYQTPGYIPNLNLLSSQLGISSQLCAQGGGVRPQHHVTYIPPHVATAKTTTKKADSPRDEKLQGKTHVSNLPFEIQDLSTEIKDPQASLKNRMYRLEQEEEEVEEEEQQDHPLGVSEDSKASESNKISMSEEVTGDSTSSQRESKAPVNNLTHSEEDTDGSTQHSSNAEKDEEKLRELMLKSKIQSVAAESELLSAKQYGLCDDSIFVAFGQMKPCALTKPEAEAFCLPTGYVGMCCKHCGGTTTKSGRFFPASKNSFLYSNIGRRIVEHLTSDCMECPLEVKKMIVELEKSDKVSTPTLNQDSSRKFYLSVWNHMRNIEKTASHKVTNLAKNDTGLGGIAGEGNGDNEINSDDSKNDVIWESLLKESCLVAPQDRYFVQDSLVFAFAQMETCRPSKIEASKLKATNKSNIGFCCRYCKGLGRYARPGNGRFFPSSMKSISQTVFCDRVVNHVATSCPDCPADVRNWMFELMESEKKERIRYTSRSVFFQRLWRRLQGDALKDLSDDKSRLKAENITPEVKSLSNEALVADSSLVNLEDANLVTNLEFVAMCQLTSTVVRRSDQVGWYRSRKRDFPGFCCRYCPGRPNDGRWFPNSARNLSHTSVLQTIFLHFSQSCEGCPPNIKQLIIDLFKNDKKLNKRALRDSEYASTRLTFYERMWNRLQQKVKDDRSVDDGCRVLAGEDVEKCVKPSQDRDEHSEGEKESKRKPRGKNDYPMDGTKRRKLN